MMRAILVAACAVIVMSSAAAAQTPELDGAWRGAYVSDDGGDINSFDITLDQTGAALTGGIIEGNSLGNSDVLFLTSTVEGRRDGARVRFTKTYDGSGGVSHQVAYDGMLDGTGRRIVGRYEAGGALGRFEIVR